MNEKYVDPAGLGEHMSIGEKEWAGFPRLMDAIGRYAPFMTTNGVILTNYSDDIEPCTARKGDVTINLGILVPASMEADVDALWATHEKFMRDTHQFGEFPPADDLKRPRVTQFTIVKAPELKDPLDPSKGTTGKIQYSMQETYCTADGIKGHFALREQYPKMFDAIMPLVSEYGVYTDLGQGLVITAMEKPSFVSNVVSGLGNFLDKALPRRAPHEEFCEDNCPEECRGEREAAAEAPRDGMRQTRDGGGPKRAREKDEEAFIISFLDNHCRKRIGGVCQHLSSSSLARFTPGRRPAALARRSMECYPSDPDATASSLLAGKTLVLPVVSHGNVGQLASDLAIEALRLPRVAILDHAALLPCVGAGAFTADAEPPATHLALGFELRACASRAPGFALARARARGPGAGRAFANDLAAFVARCAPRECVLLASVPSTRANVDGAPGPGRAHRRGRVPKRLRRPGRRGEARASTRGRRRRGAPGGGCRSSSSPRRQRERERERNGVGIAVRVARAAVAPPRRARRARRPRHVRRRRVQRGG